MTKLSSLINYGKEDYINIFSLDNRELVGGFYTYN